MSETPAFLAERLTKEGEKAAAFFSALRDEQWSMTVYSEGEQWSIRNILAHFVTSERAFMRLFRGIQAGGSGVPENFDVDQYNAAQQEQTKDETPQALLVQYQAIRAEMIAWVAALDPADLQKMGRHPFLGVTSLAEMIKLIYRHNQIHLRDVKTV